MRHWNLDFRDVRHDVEIKPHLQLFQGETFALKSTTNDDDVILDVKAKGLWESSSNKTYLDMKIFNPLEISWPEFSSETYRFQESFKKNKYE